MGSLFRGDVYEPDALRRVERGCRYVGAGDRRAASGTGLRLVRHCCHLPMNY